MRELLVGRGIDAGAAGLAIMFPDDREQEFGVLVGPDCRVYEFIFSYFNGAVGAGVLSQWTDVSATYRDGGFDEEVDAAIKLVGEETSVAPD